MKRYIMISEENEACMLKEQPTVEEVRDGMSLFLSVEIVRGDEILVRVAEVLEGEGEEEEDELDWRLL